MRTISRLIGLYLALLCCLPVGGWCGEADRRVEFWNEFRALVQEQQLKLRGLAFKKRYQSKVYKYCPELLMRKKDWLSLDLICCSKKPVDLESFQWVTSNLKLITNPGVSQEDAIQAALHIVEQRVIASIKAKDGAYLSKNQVRKVILILGEMYRQDQSCLSLTDLNLSRWRYRLRVGHAAYKLWGLKGVVTLEQLMTYHRKVLLHSVGPAYDLEACGFHICRLNFKDPEYEVLDDLVSSIEDGYALDFVVRRIGIPSGYYDRYCSTEDGTSLGGSNATLNLLDKIEKAESSAEAHGFSLGQHSWEKETRRVPKIP